MVRAPIVAGQFYESIPKQLNKQITDCFLSKFGPGKLPEKTAGKSILGVIAPHAGYPFSGACAAWAYKEIAESKQADLFIMLGLSHSGYPSCVSLENWETPLGTIETDKEFIKTLMKNSGLKLNEQAHALEHSIEVQLPFLQFINSQATIAPIIASPDIPYQELTKSIIKTINETKKNAIIIASSDFTHYGLNYGFFPFRTNVKENMYKLDHGAIEFIKKLDADSFLNYTEQTGATICGKYPIAVLTEIAALLSAKTTKLLKYYTSGDIINDYSSAVGYGAVSFE